MQHKFTFKHMQALESIEEYAKHRIEKISKYTLHKELKVHFIFETQKTYQKAEILIDSGKFHMSAEAREEDLYSSIDKAVSRLEKQLVKNKEKIQEHQTHMPRPDFASLYNDVIEMPLSLTLNKKVD